MYIIPTSSKCLENWPNCDRMVNDTQWIPKKNLQFVIGLDRKVFPAFSYFSKLFTQKIKLRASCFFTLELGIQCLCLSSQFWICKVLQDQLVKVFETLADYTVYCHFFKPTCNDIERQDIWGRKPSVKLVVQLRGASLIF